MGFLIVEDEAFYADELAEQPRSTAIEPVHGQGWSDSIKPGIQWHETSAVSLPEYGLRRARRPGALAALPIRFMAQGVARGITRCSP